MTSGIRITPTPSHIIHNPRRRARSGLLQTLSPCTEFETTVCRRPVTADRARRKLANIFPTYRTFPNGHRNPTPLDKGNSSGNTPWSRLLVPVKSLAKRATLPRTTPIPPETSQDEQDAEQREYTAKTERSTRIHDRDSTIRATNTPSHAPMTTRHPHGSIIPSYSRIHGPTAERSTVSAPQAPPNPGRQRPRLPLPPAPLLTHTRNSWQASPHDYSPSTEPNDGDAILTQADYDALPGAEDISDRRGAERWKANGATPSHYADAYYAQPPHTRSTSEIAPEDGVPGIMRERDYHPSLSRSARHSAHTALSTSTADTHATIRLVDPESTGARPGSVTFCPGMEKRGESSWSVSGEVRPRTPGVKEGNTLEERITVRRNVEKAVTDLLILGERAGEGEPENTAMRRNEKEAGRKEKGVKGFWRKMFKKR